MIDSYIGYSCDPDIRYKATSGRIGTSIIKYLFDKGIINTSITFDYDKSVLQYIPRLIYKYEDYNITGSIYHEVKLINYIRDNIENIKGGFACFVLPCQARAIRSLLNRHGIKCVLIGLTCSSQQDIEATYYLLNRLNINKKDVEYIQYRGNGWPSGIQIRLKNNTQKFIPNNNSIWTQIFHSRLFIQNRCFKCQDTLNVNSDIALADPWLKSYIENEKTGLSLVSLNTELGVKILKDMKTNDYIILNQISQNELKKSQLATIERKISYKNSRRIISIIDKVYKSNIYKKIIQLSPIFFKIHCKIKYKLEVLLIKHTYKHK